MTLNEMIYDIREKLKLNSDDIDITNDYLAHLILVKRALLVKQRFAKFTRNIPEEIKQIVCLTLETADAVNGEPCFGNILRSVETLPNLLEIGGRSALVGVRVLDKLHPHLHIIPIERMPYVGYNKWLKNQIYVALDADNKLYFTSDNPVHLNLTQIQAIGVFSDVEAADELSCVTDNTCDFHDKQYPVEAYLVSDIINLVVKELAAGINTPNDVVNNADESNRN